MARVTPGQNSWLIDLECVELRTAEGRQFCEIGLGCVKECPFSYGYDLEDIATKAFTDDDLNVEVLTINDLDPNERYSVYLGTFNTNGFMQISPNE